MQDFTSDGAYNDFSRTNRLKSWDAIMMQRNNESHALPELHFLQNFATKHNWDVSHHFLNAAAEGTQAVIITNLVEQILWVNKSFIKMTGYSGREVYDRSPKMLQGKDTALIARIQIRKCISNRSVCSTDILNYRKNGQQYWCRVEIHPVYNHDRELVNFLSFEQEITPA